jgi:hypothetical protein
MNQTNTMSTDSSSLMGDRAMRGLLWREWIAQRDRVLFFFSLWLIALVIMPLFNHPGWILGFGCLYAAILSAEFAAQDVTDGSEEFSFSLPPTRHQRYCVRLAIAGLPLAAMVVVATVATAAELPQRLWSLVVDSGFTVPNAHVRHRFMYPLAVTGPISLFGFLFPLSAVAASRAWLKFAFILTILGCALVMAAAVLCELWLWDEVNGYVLCPLQSVGAIASIWYGHVVFVRKEPSSGISGIKSRSWFWLVALLISLLVLASLAISTRSSVNDMQAQARDQMMRQVRTSIEATPVTPRQDKQDGNQSP